MEKLNEYVKIAEAAQMLGVSQNTLRAWADDGRIPAMINSAIGYRLFRREDLTGFLKQTAEPIKPGRKTKPR